MMAIQTIITGITGHMMGGGHPVPDPIFFDLPAYGHNLPGDLMPKNQRGLVYPVPFDDITAADPAGFYSDQHFFGPDGWFGHLLNSYVLIIVIHGHAHDGYPHFLKFFLIDYMPFHFRGQAKLGVDFTRILA
jgi:hypothetical protein